MKKTLVNVFGFVAAIAFHSGCQHAPTTGGDSPVTTQRLTGTRLSDIRGTLSWSFSNTLVLIENKDQPIPPDLVQELLGDQSTPKRIEATWRFDERTNLLLLTNAKADGFDVGSALKIPIRPAGHVRVNLGTRQYNLFRDTAEVP